MWNCLVTGKRKLVSQDSVHNMSLMLSSNPHITFSLICKKCKLLRVITRLNEKYLKTLQQCPLQTWGNCLSLGNDIKRKRKESLGVGGGRSGRRASEEALPGLACVAWPLTGTSGLKWAGSSPFRPFQRGTALTVDCDDRNLRILLISSNVSRRS